MSDVDENFYELGQMIGAYLHQDMDLIADSVPGAIAAYAREASEGTKDALNHEMDRFVEKFHDRAEIEFAARYGGDFTPDEIGQSVAEFFDMVKLILVSPTGFEAFESSRSKGSTSDAEG